jgi:hypothetical protein
MQAGKEQKDEGKEAETTFHCGLDGVYEIQDSVETHLDDEDEPEDGKKRARDNEQKDREYESRWGQVPKGYGVGPDYEVVGNNSSATPGFSQETGDRRTALVVHSDVGMHVDLLAGPYQSAVELQILEFGLVREKQTEFLEELGSVDSKGHRVHELRSLGVAKLRPCSKGRGENLCDGLSHVAVSHSVHDGAYDVGTGLVKHLEAPGDEIGSDAGVAAYENDDLALSILDCEIEAVVGSNPWIPEKPDAGMSFREVPDNGRGLIGGQSVGGDDLDVRVVLCQDCIEACSDLPALIVEGDAD